MEEFYYDGKNGIGISQKGIPIEKIPNGLKNNIEENGKAYFGYTAKATSNYKNINDALKDKKISQDYRKKRVEYILNSIKEVERINKSIKQGIPLVGIAFDCVEARNKAKISARDGMNPKDVQELEKRNMELYYNKIGPDLETAVFLKQAKKMKISPEKCKQMLEISEARLNNDTKKDGTKLTQEELEINKEFNEIYSQAVKGYQNDVSIYKEIILSSLKKDEEACVLLGIDLDKLNESLTKAGAKNIF